MNRNHLIFLLNALSAVFIAQSPITLGNSNMPGAGDTLRYTNVQTASIGNYTQTGTNFSWDFSTANSTTAGRRDFVAASQTPYFLFFLSANEYGEKIADTLVGGTGTITITKVYNFYKKQASPNAFIADGMGMSISGIPVPSYYSDKDELYNFPMTFPKYDSTTFKFSTTTAGVLPIKYAKQGYRTTKVDGWGTVKTPYGTDNCLRLITTQYSKDTITLTLPAIPPLPALPPIKIGIQNNVRSYQWMTLTSKIPYFEVTGNLVGNNYTITQARYRGFKPASTNTVNTTGISAIEDISALNLYPNPVKDKLWFDQDFSGNCNLTIYDVNGKLIQSVKPEVFGSLSSVDVSGLETGLYVLRLTMNEKESYCKFIKME
ncbi:MAG: T9SS type A sorting domain-containing protein [bacterium]|nr:T9SS type A sorting domain-containing protein [bacterium]